MDKFRDPPPLSRDYAKFKLEQMRRGPDVERFSGEVSDVVKSILLPYQESRDIRERSDLMAGFLSAMRYSMLEGNIKSNGQMAHTLAVQCVEHGVMGSTYHRALIAWYNNEAIKIRNALASI